MEFEAGKKYVTRGGSVLTFLGDRRVLATRYDGNQTYPLMFMNDTGVVHYMVYGGRYVYGQESCMDVMGPAPKVETLVRYVKRDSDGGLFVSEIKEYCEFLGTVTVEVTDGVLTGAKVEPCTPDS